MRWAEQIVNCACAPWQMTPINSIALKIRHTKKTAAKKKYSKKKKRSA
jgi:hypothetical protein